ncbi:hypothetical protein PR048_003054 [Dryococelus australis]|uniref:Uncharacterized protein n=1 Tax=Dryococelus australis TaxID=614101 RepID=A0ABQ9IM41_9NEOP|nr:hypothetical protein PR048_003054 [Dryococelus australis]
MITPQQMTHYVEWFIETKSDVQALHRFCTSRFKMIRSVHKRSTGWPSKSSSDVAQMQQAFLWSPTKYIWHASSELLLPTTMHRMLYKKMKLHVYKARQLDDRPKWTTFDTDILGRIAEHQDFVKKVMFIEKAFYHVSGNVNRRYMRRDCGRNREESAMAFLKDPFQHSPGVISGNHKPKSGWPDWESNPGLPNASPDSYRVGVSGYRCVETVEFTSFGMLGTTSLNDQERGITTPEWTNAAYGQCAIRGSEFGQSGKGAIAELLNEHKETCLFGNTRKFLHQGSVHWLPTEATSSSFGNCYLQCATTRHTRMHGVWNQEKCEETANRLQQHTQTAFNLMCVNLSAWLACPLPRAVDTAYPAREPAEGIMNGADRPGSADHILLPVPSRGRGRSPDNLLPEILRKVRGTRSLLLSQHGSSRRCCNRRPGRRDIPTVTASPLPSKVTQPDFDLRTRARQDCLTLISIPCTHFRYQYHSTDRARVQLATGFGSKNHTPNPGMVGTNSGIKGRDDVLHGQASEVVQYVYGFKRLEKVEKAGGGSNERRTAMNQDCS